MFAELKSRALIRVSGEEAEAFLRGLLSNDVTDLGGGARYAALLSPQGKIVFDLILIAEGGAFHLDCEASRANELIAKLKLYRLRAKVEIERDNSRAVFARYMPPFSEIEIAGKDVLTLSDPRTPHLGLRLIGAPDQIHAKLRASGLPEKSEADYVAHRRAEGVPEGASELGAEKLFLLEANAEELHGVDFQKGCYVGQELTSRMKRKSELRKRLLPLHIAGDALAGSPVTAGGDLLGQIVGGGGSIFFALLRLDRLAQARAAGAAIMAGDLPAHLHIPAYLAGKL